VQHGDHRVDHLFVLVGENPLPAYIAARELLVDGGTAHVVHSKRTGKLAEGVCKLLAPTMTTELLSLEQNESNAYEIERAIRDRVGSAKDEAKAVGRNPDNLTFGLNYTSGTAPMGVHSYIALRDEVRDAIFSYLDPRSLELRIDRPVGQPFSRPVTTAVSLQDMISLHKLNWRQGDHLTAPVMPTAAAQLAMAHAEKGAAAMWRSWCDNELNRKAKKEKDDRKWRPNDQLQALTLNLSAKECKQQLDDSYVVETSDLPEVFKKVLKDNLGATDDGMSLARAAESRENAGLDSAAFKDVRQVCRWLDGIWLESYVLDQIGQMKPTVGGVQSLDITKPEAPDQNAFEFDIAFVKGYQLYAISCTTDSDPGLCKYKMLEAVIRARQFGGDEARAALVCCVENSEKLENTLQLALTNSKVKVFGRKHLPTLSDEISTWVTVNSHPEEAANI